ncbi:MAG: response regulator transcription factor [Smithella sp.]|nr:response regulator transcription factor [Smithella sp.]
MIDNPIDITSSEKDDYSKLLESIKRNMDPKKNTVLIVDDEKGIRMKIARDVKAFDPSVVVFEATNGSEALETLTFIRSKYLRDPILIVLDLNMPVMDGWEVINRLKKEYESKGKNAGIPLLVLSSTSGEKSRFLSKKSVHEGKSGYTPLVSIAKETCVDKSHYDAVGEKGFLAWIDIFMGKE